MHDPNQQPRTLRRLAVWAGGILSFLISLALGGAAAVVIGLMFLFLSSENRFDPTPGKVGIAIGLLLFIGGCFFLKHRKNWLTATLLCGFGIGLSAVSGYIIWLLNNLPSC